MWWEWSSNDLTVVPVTVVPVIVVPVTVVPVTVVPVTVVTVVFTKRERGKTKMSSAQITENPGHSSRSQENKLFDAFIQSM